MKNIDFENLDPFAKLTNLAPKYLDDPQITIGQLAKKYNFKPSEILMFNELLCEHLQAHQQTCVQLQPDKYYAVIDQILTCNVTPPTVGAEHIEAAFREIYALDLNSKYKMIINARFQMIYPILTQAFIQHTLTH